MKQRTNESATWREARNLLARIAGIKLTKDDNAFASNVEGYHIQETTVLRFSKETAVSSTNTTLTSHSGRRLSFESFDKLVYRERIPGEHSLSLSLGPDTLEHGETNERFLEMYPKFTFRWECTDVNQPKGNLVFLRVDLTAETFANYYPGSESPRTAIGDKNLLSSLPETLKGETEIAGRAIPFEIDFETEAQKILQQSGLGEFVTACEYSKYSNRAVPA